MSKVCAGTHLGGWLRVLHGGADISHSTRSIDPATGEAEVYLRDAEGRIQLNHEDDDGGRPIVARLSKCLALLKPDAPAWAADQLRTSAAEAEA